MNPIEVAILLVVIVALSIVVAWAWTVLSERRAKVAKLRDAYFKGLKEIEEGRAGLYDGYMVLCAANGELEAALKR